MAEDPDHITNMELSPQYLGRFIIEKWSFLQEKNLSNLLSFTPYILFLLI